MGLDLPKLIEIEPTLATCVAECVTSAMSSEPLSFPPELTERLPGLDGTEILIGSN
jgi:hypothetical protein